MTTPINPSLAIAFNPVVVTPQQIIDAARKLRGLAYSSHGSAVFYDQSKERYIGRVNCLGFLLQVAKMVGLLPADFPLKVRRPRGTDGSKWDADDVMLSILRGNFVELDICDRKPGDVLVMRYADIDPEAPFHVAIVTDLDPAPEYSIIHSINCDVNGQGGRVEEHRISAEYQARILSCWRLKNLTA